jgi:serine/threonine protein kinase
MGVFSRLRQLFSSGKKRRIGLTATSLDKRFEIICKTGQGSMSRVYRARDMKLGRIVCLKVLDKVKTHRFDARFLGLPRPAEGAVSLALHHPNIVHTFEHGISTKGEQFIVMELIEGMGFNFLIETKSPQLTSNRINYLVQAATGLEAMHQQGFLHRDVCPRNMMVNQEGILKLIDFGLSIPYRYEFCKPGNRTGTSSYMAPELIKRQTTDHRIDLFALGVTAYETFTGNLPWEKGDSIQVVQRHVNTPGRNPKEFRPDLDDRTVRFLIKAVERHPDDRFRSAADFRDGLKALPPQ